MTSGRAVIEIETDSQYTVLIYKQVDQGDDQFQSATGDLTLTNAFNSARDSLAAMIGSGEKVRRVTISARIS